MFEQWDIVKFKNPDDDKESELRFIILQCRGDRLLVELINCPEFKIPPQFVYLTSDLMPV